MDIRTELNEVKAEYEKMDLAELVQEMRNMRMETKNLSKEQIIDRLMAIEEYTAFN